MGSMSKEDLEIQKLELEVGNLKKPYFQNPTFWLGAVTAFVALGGLLLQNRLAEIDAKQAKYDLDVLIARKTSAQAEISSLQSNVASLDKQVGEKNTQLVSVQNQIAAAAASLAAASKNCNGQSQVELNKVDSAIGQADVDLRSAVGSVQHVPTGVARGIPDLVSGLFAATAAERGNAYNQLVLLYPNPALIPQLLSYALAHPDNLNGIYNTLVFLGQVDLRNEDVATLASVRSYVESVRDKGPKIAERVAKVLSRGPFAVTSKIVE